MATIPCGNGVSVVRTIPVQQPKLRFNDDLGRTQEERRFVKNFDRIFSAASIGDLSACQKIVKKGFRDFNAYSQGKEKSSDNVSPVQIAKTNQHQHIVDYFKFQMNLGAKPAARTTEPQAESEESEETPFNGKKFQEKVHQRLEELQEKPSKVDDESEYNIVRITTKVRRPSSASLSKPSFSYSSLQEQIFQETNSYS